MGESAAALVRQRRAMGSGMPGVCRMLRGRAAVVVALGLACRALTPAAGRADVSPLSPDVVVSDGYETGALGASTALGTGTASVTAAAAHAGAFGLRLANGVGQYELAARTLPEALPD